MKILETLHLDHRITKSAISADGKHAFVLFDNSTFFGIIEVTSTNLKLAYYQDLKFIILDACFAADNKTIFLAGLGSEIIEWDYTKKTILQKMGQLVPNKFDPDISGYSSLAIIPKLNFLAAANIGNSRLEVMNYLNSGLSLGESMMCEMYSKKILVHPSQNLIAVLIVDSEDSGAIRIVDISNGNLRCYTKYIDLFFAPSGLSFNAAGDQIIITGGYPPFNFQVHEFPSLEFVNEFTDDEGLEIPEPWGNSNGTTFNNDFLLTEVNTIYVPYFNGNICEINLSTGEIIQAISCHAALCNSLSYSGQAELLLCSSINGEVSILTLERKIMNNTIDDQDFKLPSEYISDNLLVPLKEMEDFFSDLDEPVQITAK